MSLRIDTPMSLARPVEATAEKASELARQGLNAPAMKRDEAEQTERKLHRAQAAKETEGRRIQADECGKDRGGRPDRDEPEETEPSPEGEDQLTRLKRRAEQRLLGLSVEPNKKDKCVEHRLDITL